MPAVSNGQEIAISFRPVDSQYSLALDRIIMVSANPNQLHIYDPPSNSDVTVKLSATPLNVSVSPDGLHAAVMHDSLVSYVNLNTAAVEKTFSVATSTGIVALSQDYVYVLPTYDGSVYSILLTTGQISTSLFAYGSGGKFNSAVTAIYGTMDGISPNDLLKYDASGGAITSFPSDSPYHGDYPICGNVWFSPDQTWVYTGCATVFHASTDATVDRTYVASLPGLNGVQSLDASALLKRVAVVPSASVLNYPLPAQSDNEVRLFESDYLTQVGRFVMPDFVVGSNSFQAHVKSVFFNQASSAIFAVMEADASSGLLNDFAVQTIPLQNPTVCNASFASDAASAVGSGTLGTVQVNAGTECTFTAQSNVPWIELVSGQYGSGDGTLTYLVRPNLNAAPRTGTISMGSATFTVTQDAAPASSSFNRLSFEVAAADYSKTLNKIVLVSAAPNELHIYDPISQADLVVPLIRAPATVSVSPDGTHAAVGHDGWVSYINLQTASVEQVFAVPGNVHGIVLAGNGYIYTFPQYDFTTMQSLEIATGTITQAAAYYAGTVPRLYPLGGYLYVAGSEFEPKWDITQGPAQRINFVPQFEYSDCGNLWLTEDGKRMFTACATVYSTSEVPAEDLLADGSLSGAGALTWAATSLKRAVTAVITAQSWLSDSNDTTLQIYNNAGLSLSSQTTLPLFSVGGSNYTGHGRFLFWDGSETNLFAILQADSTAKLASDYAVYTVPSLGPPPTCSITLSANSFHTVASGGTESITINADSFCSWSAQSNASWLTFSGTSSGSGPGQISLVIALNETSTARTGSVTIGGNTVTVTQDANAPIAPPSAPGTVNFGNQALGVTSAPQPVTISANSQLSGLSIVPSSTEFSVQAGSCQLSSSNYGGCALAVTFTPAAFGQQTASLNFSINGTPVSVTLTGFGVSGTGPQPWAFEIQNRLSGKVLDVTDFSMDRGTLIQQWTAAASDNQKWLIIPTPDGYYKIQNQLSGKVLDVTNFSTDNGALIQQWDDVGSDNQKWSIVPVDGQNVEIVNKFSGKVLDVTNFSIDNGAQIQQWQYAATENQQWQLIPVTNSVPNENNAGLPSGYIAIVNRLSGKSLDVTNFSTADGTQIQQWQYAGTENQQWLLVGVDDTYYKIVSRFSGKVLDVRNFSTSNGAPVQQWDYEQSANQLWQIVPEGQYFKIVNKLSGLVLDMTNFSMENGGTLQQWQDVGTLNQQWSFSAVTD